MRCARSRSSHCEVVFTFPATPEKVGTQIWCCKGNRFPLTETFAKLIGRGNTGNESDTVQVQWSPLWIPAFDGMTVIQRDLYTMLPMSLDWRMYSLS